ncbi:MAG TPA: hypothetical protein VFN53_00085 [Acidobacteriaceae bacterium]|nr:hypothetical protein [Acidobacteriaceae bacterium]
MHNLRLCFFFLLGSVLCPAMIFAQAQPSPPSAAATSPNPKTPEEFFARARQLSDLEAAGIPFHLKATYVASGDAEFTSNETYEEWWESKDTWRKEATLGGYRYVGLRKAGVAIFTRPQTTFLSDCGKQRKLYSSEFPPMLAFPGGAESKSACFSKNKKSPLTVAFHAG